MKREILCFLLLVHLAFSLDVQTSIGTIRGKFESFGSRGVYKFLGIPYAEPPVGDLRFKPPVSKAALNEPLNAVRTGPICPQHEIHKTFFNFTHDPDNDFTMSEDCLYMNIYVPTNAAGDLPQNLPVMFYIHSGGWSWGSGSHYDGRWLALNANVILVTFNYRLSILGFLRTEDRKIINNGFKDQIMAFKFAHHNIDNFGGDRNSITVFGQSAGGASTVYIHAVPELSGMIKRVIALAGVPSATFANFLPLDKRNLTKHIADASGCDDDFVNCLRRKSVDDLIRISCEVTASMKMLTAWMPSPDFKLISPLSTHYQSKLSKNGFAQVDLMTNMAVSEGTSLAWYISGLQKIKLKDELSLEEIKTISLVHELHPDVDDILRDLTKGKTSVPRAEAMDVITELTSLYPMYDLARKHDEVTGESKKTYVFVYDYVPKDRHGLLPRPDWQPKTVHGDELPLVFGYFLSEVNKAKYAKDAEISRVLLTYISNFVKTGDPNHPEPVPVQWSEFTGSKPMNLFFSDQGFEDIEFKLPIESTQYWDRRYGFDDNNRSEHDEL